VSLSLDRRRFVKYKPTLADHSAMRGTPGTAATLVTAGSMALTVPLLAGAARSRYPKPAKYSVPPERTCHTELATFHDGSKPARRPVVVPPAPGLRATALTSHMVRLEWSLAAVPAKCKPAQLLLSIVNYRHAQPFTVTIPTRSRLRGNTRITYPAFAPRPDVALASSLFTNGLRSRVVSVLIRR
jgi:hypothetical protein